ncbi:hypothetical protein WA026_003746 [Henosepilachna vigintioctopunctata]|uniref:Reduced folate carrier n=1 Tax=Henosepilachna vigintioctopunctata TaxID=420089 RepID=A0AAW1UCR1_9CUCU
MESWLKLSLILCFFGFLKEIRPSEHYIYEYLTGHWRNVTEHEVLTEVYPVGTYSYLCLLVVIFLITDLLRYRPLIVVLGISGIIYSAMLTWTTSLFCLQVLEVFYSIFMAAEVAYYTYIYAKVDKEHYNAVTSHTRASLLAGRFFSGILAQVLVSFKWMDYKQLNYLTFAAMMMATFWSFFLPPVKKSIYFHQEKETERTNNFTVFHRGISLMKEEIIQTFTNTYVIKWSTWYALSSCCFYQVQSYAQPLWSDVIDNSNAVMYNGAVEAILTLSGFLAALSAGILRVDWEVRGDLLLIASSSLQGIILVIGALTTNIYLCYMCYILYGLIHHFVITVTSSEIAKKVKDDTFGLIFGFNTFIAMIFQSLLMLIVVNDVFKLKFDIRQQYVVYGCCCFVIAFIYVVVSLRNIFNRRRGFELAAQKPV